MKNVYHFLISPYCYIKHCSGSILLKSLPIGIFLSLLSTSGQSQLIVDNNVNAVDGVQNVLLGEGVVVSNITFTGTNNQVASFTCDNCNVGLEAGLILAAGNASLAVGPNNSGSTSSSESGFGATDPDLALAMGGNLNDAAVLQFDFVPTGDSLVFRYVFASEEYSEFLGFGDIFGFFLSGPGISGPYTNNAINIAIVPGTTSPVSVPNVNNGSTGTNGPCVNCAYFVHNGNGSQSPYNGSNFYIQHDGFTTVLTAEALVQCGETYHIKLAVADWSDTSWDSAVFLEAGSFQSNQVAVDFEVPDFAPSDTSVYEGCDEAYVTFSRPGSTEEEMSFDLSFGGTAINGVDYFLVGQTLTFGVGESEVSLPILAFQDGIAEGSESITISVESGIACLINSYFELTIEEATPLNVTMPDVQIDCGDEAVLLPDISGAIGVYNVTWSTGQIDTSIVVSPQQTTTYTYTVSDTCTVESISGSVTVVIPDYDPLIADIGPDLELSCLNTVDLSALVDGGHGPFSFEWNYLDSLLSDQQDVSFQTSDPGTLTITVTDQCGEVTTDELEISFPPITVLVDLGEDEEANCLSNLFINSDVEGGAGEMTYSWTVNGAFFGDGLAIVYPVEGPATIVLSVTDQCGNVGTDEMLVSIDPSGIDVSLGPNQTITCLDQVVINPDVEGGDGSITYEWTVNGQNAGSGTTLTLDPDQTTTVTLTVIDQCGWEESDEMIIQVPAVPVTLVVSEDQVLCPGESITLEADASGGVGSLDFVWSPGGGGNSSILVSPDVTTVYSITVADECGNDAEAEIEVMVYAYEPFAVAEDFTICVDVSRPGLVSGGQPPYIITYSSSHVVIEDGYLEGISPGNVVVNIEDQCGNSGSFTVIVSSCETLIPNIFTPNNDVENQNFFIDGLSGYPGSTLKVFNRWGNLVYENDNYKNNWDGQETAEGTYFYVFERVDGKRFEGYLTLVRDTE